MILLNITMFYRAAQEKYSIQILIVEPKIKDLLPSQNDFT